MIKHFKVVPAVFALTAIIFFLGCSEDSPDPNANLTCRVVDARNSYYHQVYVYNAKGLIASAAFEGVTSEINGNSTFTYDDSDRLIKISNSDNSFTTYEYNDKNQIIRESYTPNFELPEISRAIVAYDITYDDNGRIYKKTFIDNINHAYSRYEYDDRGNVKKIYFYELHQPEYLMWETLAVDDKKNPWTVVPFATALTFGDRPMGIELALDPKSMGPNNIVKYAYYDAEGKGKTVSLKCRYNASGYLLQSTTGTFLATDPLTYECF